MARSLQIKRNKNIFNNKREAIDHLNSLVKKLDDGEIVLCRYFYDGTIQTLVGFETNCAIENELGEYIEKKSITYVDSLSEVGKGFFYDENGIIQLKLGSGLHIDNDNKIQISLDKGLEIKNEKLNVKLNEDIKNFLQVDDKGLKVVDMDTDTTKTTEKIAVVGGPLATEEVKNEIANKFGVDENDNPFIPADTNLQDLLSNLFFKEVFPTISSSNSVQGNVTNRINAPVLILSSDETELEVGTSISISSASFSGNSYALTESSIVSGLTYGYSLSNNNKRSSRLNNITQIPTNSIVTSAQTRMVCETTGFTKSGFSEITGTTVLTKSSHDLGKIKDGSNKIKISISGQPISYSIAEIPVTYPCSNVGKTSSACVTTKVDAKSGTLVAPTNNISKEIIGVRYGFYGCVSDSFVINSNNLRGLTKLKKQPTSSFVITGTNVVRVVIAIPTTWDKKTIDNVKDNNSLDAIVTNTYILQSTKYDVKGANDYDSVQYNVYVYDTKDTKENFKHTITLK